MNLFLSRAARFGMRRYQRLMAVLSNQSRTDRDFIMDTIVARGIPAALGFEQQRFNRQVLSFVDSMAMGSHRYRYSPSVAEPTLYSSVYACLTKAIFGQVAKLDPAERRAWASYFDGFQSPEDGLFRDDVVANDVYEHSDWWGARHLVLHMITAYAALGYLPRYRFHFLDDYKSLPTISNWLDAQDWQGSVGLGDVDNKIMNIVCALQFERDFRSDQEAHKAVDFILLYLSQKIDQHTGLWGSVDISNPAQLSRGIQFAYHLYPTYFHDGRAIANVNRIIDLVLMTQNPLGGYGVEQNSSACEDIDSLDLLCRLSRMSTWRRGEVELSIKRAMVWILANQNEDGGFVFRRNAAFTYGHPAMSSGKNESAMFPTWFRTLSLAYATRYLGSADYALDRCAGLQSWNDI